MKKIILLLLVILLFSAPVFAEKIPVKIELNQFISTEADNAFEVGDEIAFRVVNDVYSNGNIFVQKNTPVYGVIDFIHDNGWLGDSAEIRLKTFVFKDAKGKKISTNFPLDIDRQYNTENKKKNFTSCKMIFLSIFRGNELNILPNTLSFNIIIEE